VDNGIVRIYASCDCLLDGSVRTVLVNAFLETYRGSAGARAVADQSRSLTYKQLGLFAMGIRTVVDRDTRGERVGIMLPASSVFPPVLLGVLWSSKIAVPLNFLLNEQELSPIVRDADLDLIITVRHFEKLAAALPTRVIFLEDIPLKRMILTSMLRRTPPPPEVHPDDTAVILYTSGTTAQPKGVELTQNNLYTNCVDSIASLNLDAKHRILNILPPFHVFGLTANVLMPIVLGASVYAIARFNPAGVIKTIAKERISVIMAIPSMYGALLRTKSARREDFESFELAISGGEPLPDSVREGFADRFGITLRQGYGLTETSPVVAVSSVAVFRDGTVGKPLKEVSIRIVSETGDDLPTGHDGEILVKGPGVMKGYYKKPEETEKVIDSDGWFHTGDVGHLDQDGFLAITGRAKEMLIIGGENVFPREIEAVLETHPEVLQAAVIGIPDASRGEVPVAFVIPRHGCALDEQELRSYARRSLAGFKVPKQIHIREDLPTGPTGKILKRRLHDLLG
jgi:long-chain acyl-CoA synthetase